MTFQTLIEKKKKRKPNWNSDCVDRWRRFWKVIKSEHQKGADTNMYPWCGITHEQALIEQRNLNTTYRNEAKNLHPDIWDTWKKKGGETNSACSFLKFCSLTIRLSVWHFISWQCQSIYIFCKWSIGFQRAALPHRGYKTKRKIAHTKTKNIQTKYGTQKPWEEIILFPTKR